MPRNAVLALVVVVAAVIGVAAVVAVLAARDDSTVSSAEGPGVVRTTATTQPGLVGENQPVEPGNVVLFYSDERLTRGLRELATDVGGPSDTALVAAGQAVIVRRRPNQPIPVVAVSATHQLDATGPSDPALREFVEYWLGRTAR
jgi:hypothetical protein